MTASKPIHFIRHIIEEDLRQGKHTGLITRFPPEPNGYLHIGHAKSICINFGLADDYDGQCFLRFDDTNPINESDEYKRAILEDVQWMGYAPPVKYTSDYFEYLYEKARLLIKNGLAYVDSLTAEQMREYRGTLTSPGRNSPDRSRSIAENLDLFQRMRSGEFADGAYTLRAKIDMAAGNLNLRDPAIYRIRRVTHQRTHDQWCIYPMYDFSHALSDAHEGITHSLCTLEFQDHRPLYDWFVANSAPLHTPRQIEFSRLNLSYTVTSKRKLKQLVDQQYVTGWDDPRMPTLSGLRRRGVPAAAIHKFCQAVGVSKQDSVIELSVFEATIRDHLNDTARRRMAVLNPLKVIITNYPEDDAEMLTQLDHPQHPEMGERSLRFSRELYIDRDDFSLDPPGGFNRLTLNGEVRLRGAYAVRCHEVVKDEHGQVVTLLCRYDPDTLGGKKPLDGRQIKGTLHWLCAENAVDAVFRVFDRLFQTADPGAGDDFLSHLNPESLMVYHGKVEPALASAIVAEPFQLLRLGYYARDRDADTNGTVVFNRIVTLKETWR